MVPDFGLDGALPVEHVVGVAAHSSTCRSLRPWRRWRSTVLAKCGKYIKELRRVIGGEEFMIFVQ